MGIFRNKSSATELPCRLCRDKCNHLSKQTTENAKAILFNVEGTVAKENA